MSDYNEGSNIWNGYFTDGELGNLAAGKGFEIRTGADGTVEFAGTLLEGGAVAADVTTSGYGWNSVGNPYPSAIYINNNANARITLSMLI